MGLLNTKNGNYTPLYILRLCNRRFKDLDIIRCGLSYLTTRFHIFRCGGNREGAIKVASRENHALALFAHHLARSKVGNKQYVLANELLWLIVGSDAAEDSAVLARTIVDGEL